jgi:hypothetical protein
MSVNKRFCKKLKEIYILGHWNDRDPIPNYGGHSKEEDVRSLRSSQGRGKLMQSFCSIWRRCSSNVPCYLMNAFSAVWYRLWRIQAECRGFERTTSTVRWFVVWKVFIGKWR